MCAVCDRAIHAVASNQFRISDINAVLRHETAYDDLPPSGRAVVRLVRDRQVDAGRAGIDLAPALIAAGASWSELDADGNVVIRNARS